MPEDPTQNSAPRSTWGAFPSVLRNAGLGVLKREPEYPAAKAGDARAALDLADRVITAEFGEAVRSMGSGHTNPVLPIRPQMMDNIRRKHGIQESEDFAHEQWGYGIEYLTQGKAGHLYKAVSLDALRDRFTAARDEHRRRMGTSRTGAPLPERLEGTGKNAVTASSLSTQTHLQGPDDIFRPDLSVFQSTPPHQEDFTMAFGAHLRPAAPTATTDVSVEEAVTDKPLTEDTLAETPAEDSSAEGTSPDQESRRLQGIQTEEQPMADPDAERMTHMEAFQDVLRDIVELRTLQGDTQSASRVPLVAKGLLDCRGIKDASLADICDKVIDRAYFKVPQSEHGPGLAPDGNDRWVMTPENQAAEKSANLETAQMISDHLEQSGVDLDLVAEQFQILMERAESESMDDVEAAPEAQAESSAELPALVDEPVFNLDPSSGLRTLTDVEYQEIQKKKEEKDPEKDDLDDDEEDDAPSFDSRDLGASLVLLSMHMQAARSRKQMARTAAATAAPSVKQEQPSSAPKDQKSNPALQARSFSLPHPRLPRLHLPAVTGMDYEAFVRNRRTGQILATRDALLKMDRLFHLRGKTTDPETLKNIDGKLEKQAKRLLKQGSAAFDQKGLDFLARGGADPKVITDTMERMEQWKKQFAPSDDLKNTLGDALGQALEKLARLIQNVIDRVTGRGSAQGSDQTRNAAADVSRAQE
ncbi:MAG: hypothetical protein ACYCQL_05305 [Acidithiobacillus sp.]